MNARLNPEHHEKLLAHADTCSAVCQLFLETSEKYLDLQLESIKAHLDLCRKEMSTLPAEVDMQAVVACLSQLMSQSMAQGSEVMREAQKLATQSQLEMQKLWDQGALQFRQSAAQMSEMNLNLLKTMLGQANAAVVLNKQR